jgi:hypothetical protein
LNVSAASFDCSATSIHRIRVVTGTPRASCRRRRRHGDFDFVAPFSFNADIRGVQGGRTLFAQQFIGQGFVSVNYEGTLRPGVFAAEDESIT